MLYELWQKVASSQRHKMALLDLITGRRWTFGEILAAGESSSLPHAPIVPVSGCGMDFLVPLLASWKNQLTACPLEPGQVQPDFTPPHGATHLKSSSATGGSTNWIAFEMNQLAADAGQIVKTMGLHPDQPNLGVISLSHSYGFSNLVLPLLLHGIPLIAAPAPLPEILRLAARLPFPICLPAVPALWQTWHDAQVIPPNTSLAISAGAPLPLRLEWEVFERSGLKIHNFLGSSECGGIAYDSSPTPRTDASLAGSTLPCVTASLDASGCLAISSAAVGMTYCPSPQPHLKNGCFQTSDLAVLQDGQVFLKGRIGDQINVAGRKVSPDAIESLLREHPQVADCLVFGAPSRDSRRTEDIVALVVTSASEFSLAAFLTEKLPAWQIPRIWLFPSSMPANARGKTSRTLYRQLYLENRLPN